jgi:multidrug efflux pump
MRNLGLADGKPAIVILIVYKQPGANIVETVDKVRRLMPQLKASLPAIDINMAATARHDPRLAARAPRRRLMIAVILVIWWSPCIFLRSWRATLIPVVAVPVSLGDLRCDVPARLQPRHPVADGTDMATGFVVDDAIVVLENITRHIEAGSRGSRRPCSAPARSASPCCR